MCVCVCVCVCVCLPTATAPPRPLEQSARADICHTHTIPRSDHSHPGSSGVRKSSNSQRYTTHPRTRACTRIDTCPRADRHAPMGRQTDRQAMAEGTSPPRPITLVLSFSNSLSLSLSVLSGWLREAGFGPSQPAGWQAGAYLRP